MHVFVLKQCKSFNRKKKKTQQVLHQQILFSTTFQNLTQNYLKNIKHFCYKFPFLTDSPTHPTLLMPTIHYTWWEFSVYASLLSTCSKLILSLLPFIASIILSCQDNDFDGNLLPVVIFNKAQPCLHVQWKKIVVN